MALNFAQPLGRVGGALGGTVGAAGGGFLGRLGSLLEPLDYARQAAWNIPDKLREGDILGALPGLAGVGLGAGLAATGFGLPVAAMAGTALGALGQGAGKLYDAYLQPTTEGDPATAHFQARTPGELLKAMTDIDPDTMEGSLMGMGLGMATDPLTYTGGAFGGAIGRAIGRSFAPALENAARLRGPGYTGGVEKILGGPELWAQSAERASLRAPRMMEEIAGSPYASRVLGEIPQGSTPLGAGMEGVAFRTPDGNVIRIAGGGQSWDTIAGRGFNGEPTTGTMFPLGTDGLDGSVKFPHIDPMAASTMPAPAPRTDSPLMLQPARDLAIGPYRVEHLPMAGTIPTAKIEQGLTMTPIEEAMYDQIRQGKPTLDRSVLAGGGKLVDAHMGNIGVGPQGNVFYTDPGAITGVGSTAERLPGAPPTGRMTNWLLDALGANRGVQEEIAERLANTGAQGLSPDQVMAIRQQMYGPNRVYRGANLLPNRPDLPATVRG